MKTYLIGYDLNKGPENYSDLIEAIKGLTQTWWHHLDSTWILKSDESAESIRNTLKPYLDANDELLVIEHQGEAAWAGFSDKGSTWLRNNL